MDPNQQIPNQPMQPEPAMGADPNQGYAYPEMQGAYAQPEMMQAPGQAGQMPGAEQAGAGLETGQVAPEMGEATAQNNAQALMEAEMRAATEQEQADRMKAQQVAAAMAKPKKSGNGMLIGLALAAIVAVGGVGFGVYMMISGQQNEQNYQKQIANLKNTVNQLNAQIEEGDEVAEAFPTEDYIYMSAWGIKLMNPINYARYTFYNNAPQAVDRFEIRESANAGGGVSIFQATEDFCNTESETPRQACVEVGDNLYGITELTSELEEGSESAVTGDFWNFVTNSENYSEI